MEKSQVVVFISTPGIGNIVPTVEFAHRLTNHHPRFSATILTIAMPRRPIVNSYLQSPPSSSHVHFLPLPTVDPPSPNQYQSSLDYGCLFIENHKPHVKSAIRNLKHSSRVVGLFVDMFSASMIDVATELGIPCYLFFASPASFLGFMIHLPELDAQLGNEFIDWDTGLIVPKEPGTELIVPSYVNPLPPQMLPNSVLKRKRDGYFWYLTHGRRYVEMKGIVVNTFRELETHAVDSLLGNGIPPVYPIGPVLDLVGPAKWHPDRTRQGSVMEWLDDQPASSVVFLCFGSMGSLRGPQLQEIAVGLERSGFRFLWSIREPPKGDLDIPGEYANVEEILPEGFLDRTAGIGLVCGWVPQVNILSHQAIGGFVSHCGWNSVLESLWYGVPIATWPVYAEQQMNAFAMVRELGLAIEIRLDYREGRDLVMGDELERGIKRLMERDGEVRRKVEEMSKKSRMAVMEDGSSYAALTSLVEELAAEI